MAQFGKVCSDGKLSKIRELVSQEGDVGPIGTRGSGLQSALANKHFHVVEYLLSVPGVDINYQDNFGNTALYVACTYNERDIARGVILLLAHPGMTSLNTRNNEGQTPILGAASRGNVNCVRALAALPGVDLEVRDNMGRGLQEVARLGVSRVFVDP